MTPTSNENHGWTHGTSYWYWTLAAKKGSVHSISSFQTFQTSESFELNEASWSTHSLNNGTILQVNFPSFSNIIYTPQKTFHPPRPSTLYGRICWFICGDGGCPEVCLRNITLEYSYSREVNSMNMFQPPARETTSTMCANSVTLLMISAIKPCFFFRPFSRWFTA